MFRYKDSFVFRILILLLIAILIFPINTVATEYSTPDVRASHYLTSYNTYVYPAALGKIQIWFSVTGVNVMDEIGVLNIHIYESTDNENWTWVKTYKHTTTSGMLDYDTIYYSNYVQHQGTIGRYYKAYVCIWAGKDGGGDTRYMWTDIEKATLFAG